MSNVIISNLILFKQADKKKEYAPCLLSSYLTTFDIGTYADKKKEYVVQVSEVVISPGPIKKRLKDLLQYICSQW